ncbi:poly-gamma-glutamate synthesis protein (capsule biosynthesis protein) [Actinacidiphila alni]|uniref:Poly-gamma-glutamate synthesis protein (Capsule biosynthesis protein) n=1 Tax=Actinacidiphila alni TaxID=380248 RepID=A0A1I2I351_9ACTN|nr:CapA family protein [Actinacidiphila alni]SFF36050.1 poly-gamma-glutamate synthesis protein (capsule biosynthesis protein) [Actinacidiphila alni]
MSEGHRPRSRREIRRARARRRRRNTAVGGAVLLLAAAGSAYAAYGRDSGSAPRTESGARPATDSTATTTAMPSLKPTVDAASRPAEPTGTVTLAFAGDVHFTERTAGRLGVTPALGPMSRTLAAADFSMVNLESAITTRGTAQAKKYHFRTTPDALSALQRSGVDAVTMANNHAVDYGSQGLADSLAAQHDAPVPVVGIGADAAEAYRPYTTTVNGVRLAVLAASQVYDITNQNFRATATAPGIASALDRPRLLKAVRDAKAHADVVVVYLHWGVEGQKCPVADQKSIAADLSAAGATAVVGTHAHVMLGSGMLGPTYVAYGFGNFLWYGTSPYPNSDETGVTTLTVSRGKVTGAAFTPGLVDGAGVPQPQQGAAGRRITDRYAQLRRCTGLTAPPAR